MTRYRCPHDPACHTICAEAVDSKGKTWGSVPPKITPGPLGITCVGRGIFTVGDRSSVLDATGPDLERMREFFNADPHAKALLRSRILADERLFQLGINERLREYAAACWAESVGDVECRTCDICDRSYRHGDGENTACPVCVPSGPTLNEHLANRERWPGHGFMWSEMHGPRGRWVLFDEYIPIKRSSMRQLDDLLPDDKIEMEIFSCIAAELRRLRAIAATVSAPVKARAEREQQRASDLADACGKLNDQLEAKRVQCDVLRDKITDLKRRSS